MKKYLGVDIGGTAVKLGVIDENGQILEKRTASVSFDGYRTPILDAVICQLRDLIESRRTAAGEAEIHEGICVSATGQVDSKEGKIIGTCGNLPGWNGVCIRERLEAAFGLPVTVANDANCMCLGEQWIGAAAGVQDVIGITIGTGVGGGIITGGRLLEGSRGLGGEIGHFMIHALDGEECTCGNRGCYEHYAATTALVRRGRAMDPDWTDGLAVFHAAACGDRQARELLDLWTREIAAGLVGLVHIFNPSLIVIGGGVSAQEELLIRPVEKLVKASAMPAFSEGLTVKAAQLKNDAGMIGAVHYFRKHRN